MYFTRRQFDQPGAELENNMLNVRAIVLYYATFSNNVISGEG